MIQMKLTQIFEAQIKYVDGDKNHPFLEEIVSIFASFFERLGMSASSANPLSVAL